MGTSAAAQGRSWQCAHWFRRQMIYDPRPDLRQLPSGRGWQKRGAGGQGNLQIIRQRLLQFRVPIPQCLAEYGHRRTGKQIDSPTDLTDRRSRPGPRLSVCPPHQTTTTTITTPQLPFPFASRLCCYSYSALNLIRAPPFPPYCLRLHHLPSAGSQSDTNGTI